MRILIFIILFIANWTELQASAFWLEVLKPTKGNNAVKVQVSYGFIDQLSIRHRTREKEYESIATFEFRVRSTSGQEWPMQLIKKADCWEGEFTAAPNTFYQIIGINRQLPVIVRHEKDASKNIRSIEYLYGEYGRQGSQSALPILPEGLYVNLQKQQGHFNISPYMDGQSAPIGSIVRVFNPENWEKNIPLDTAGHVPMRPTMQGLYVIRYDWYEEKPGQDNTISFSRIRHRCNYCINIYE